MKHLLPRNPLALLTLLCLLVPEATLFSEESTHPLLIDYPPQVAINGPSVAPPGTNFETFDLGRKPVPPLVPAGTTNLSLQKKVSSSTGATNLSWITNGDKSPRLMEQLGPVGVKKQWIQIDLGARADIYAIVVWHCYYYPELVYFDIVVQVCNDPGFSKDVVTVFNNDKDNHHGLGVGSDRLYFETRWGKTIETKGAMGRYVRLYSNGSSMSRLNEYLQVEVYGK